MAKKPNPAKQYHSYEVIMQEDPSNGDVLVPLPPQLLAAMGWKEGDQIEFIVDEHGKYVLKKFDK